MQYPKELATAVQQASRSYPLKDLFPVKDRCSPIDDRREAPDEPKSRILLLLADKQEKN